MRVRPKRSTDRRRLRLRRPDAIGAPPPPPPAPLSEPRPDAEPEPEPATDPPVPADDPLIAERRHRASVNPEDSALYGCQCGYQFRARVTASVACPHCGCGQAW